jgi:hypothetical protein
LGAEEELEWTFSERGLTVGMPIDRPCQHAYVLKIERGRPF